MPTFTSSHCFGTTLYLDNKLCKVIRHESKYTRVYCRLTALENRADLCLIMIELSYNMCNVVC